MAFGLTLVQHPHSIYYMKSFTWHRLGVGIVAVWLIVLVATIGATAYREIDGPTVRSVTAENIELSQRLERVSKQLDSTLASLSVAERQLTETEMRYYQVADQLDLVKAWWTVGALSVDIP